MSLCWTLPAKQRPLPSRSRTCTEDKAVLDAIAASLSVLDDWDESDCAKVNAAGYATTCSVDITRPSNATQFAANEAYADTTPTVGGFTLTSAARISGGSGIITDITIVCSNDPSTLLQGELWIFDSAVAEIADNAAFALTDADAKKLVGVVPFTLATTVAGSGTNSYANIQNLSLGFTCVGSADLRFLVKTKNAYTPASGEVLTVRAKIVQTN